MESTKLTPFQMKMDETINVANGELNELYHQRANLDMKIARTEGELKGLRYMRDIHREMNRVES